MPEKIFLETDRATYYRPTPFTYFLQIQQKPDGTPSLDTNRHERDIREFPGFQEEVTLPMERLSDALTKESPLSIYSKHNPEIQKALTQIETHLNQIETQAILTFLKKRDHAQHEFTDLYERLIKAGFTEEEIKLARNMRHPGDPYPSQPTS